MKKFLIALLLLAVLLLSGCRLHVDTEPWPASPGYQPEVDGTQAPGPQTTDAPSGSETTALPAITPTPPPSDNVPAPGFNG